MIFVYATTSILLQPYETPIPFFSWCLHSYRNSNWIQLKNGLWFIVVCTISTTLFVITVIKTLWTHEVQPSEPVTDRAKPLSICSLSQYRLQVKRLFQYVTTVWHVDASGVVCTIKENGIGLRDCDIIANCGRKKKKIYIYMYIFIYIYVYSCSCLSKIEVDLDFFVRRLLSYREFWIWLLEPWFKIIASWKHMVLKDKTYRSDRDI